MIRFLKHQTKNTVFPGKVGLEVKRKHNRSRAVEDSSEKNNNVPQERKSWGYRMSCKENVRNIGDIAINWFWKKCMEAIEKWTKVVNVPLHIGKENKRIIEEQVFKVVNVYVNTVSDTIKRISEPLLGKEHSGFWEGRGSAD